MRLGLVITSFCLWFNAISQETQPEKHWVFGVSATVLNGHALASLATPVVGASYKNKSGSGAAIAASCRRMLDQRISLESGLGFSNYSVGVEATGLVFGSDIDPTLGIISTSSLTERIHLNEVQVPLLMRYVIWADRVYISSGLMGAFQFNMDQQRTIYLGNGIETNSSYTPDPILNFSIPASVGWTWTTSGNRSIKVELQARYYVRKFPNNFSGSRIITTGLSVGLEY